MAGHDSLAQVVSELKGIQYMPSLIHIRSGTTYTYIQQKTSHHLYSTFLTITGPSPPPSPLPHRHVHHCNRSPRHTHSTHQPFTSRFLRAHFLSVFCFYFFSNRFLLIFCFVLFPFILGFFFFSPFYLLYKVFKYYLYDIMLVW